jgi:enamine deaminase RidA (YjgF/YER057c/UK114 family)
MTAAPRGVNPPGLAPATGYSHGMLAPEGAVLFVAGQVGWDAAGRLVSADLVGQFEQALANLLAVVRAAGGAPEHVTRLRIYVTDLAAYRDRRRDLGVAYRRQMGRHYPAMALVQVAGLLEEGAQVEVEADAVVPR